MHPQPRATEHPLALKSASRSDPRCGLRGTTVNFIGHASGNEGARLPEMMP